MAGLGHHDEALALPQQARGQVPVSKDMVDGVFNAWLVARIHARIGNAADAASQLGELLDISSGMFVSPPSLKADAAWDPIRENEGFRALLEG